MLLLLLLLNVYARDKTLRIILTARLRTVVSLEAGCARALAFDLGSIRSAVVVGQR